MTNIAILASGSGSIAEQIMRSQGESYQVKVIITDNADAGVVLRANKRNIPVKVIPSKGLSRSAHEKQILVELLRYDIEWVCLAGYMRLLQESFIQHFYDERLNNARILNIHPALLPKYPGFNGYAQALEGKERFTGATVHYVDRGMDTGDIIAQSKIEINENDNLDNLIDRGKLVEAELYTYVLKNKLREVAYD